MTLHLTFGPELRPWLGQLVYPPGPRGRGRALPASRNAAPPGHQAGLEGELLPHLCLGAPQNSLLGHLGVGPAQLEGPALAAALCLVEVQSTACLKTFGMDCIHRGGPAYKPGSCRGRRCGLGSSMAPRRPKGVIVSTHSECPLASEPYVGSPRTTSLLVRPACL